MRLISKLIAGIFGGLSFDKIPDQQSPRIGIVGKSDIGKTAISTALSKNFGSPLYRVPTRCELYGRHKGRNSRVHKPAKLSHASIDDCESFGVMKYPPQ